MVPRMSEAELALFRSFVGRARGYVEFGSGGSTFLAAQSGAGFIVSTDSAQAWLDSVRTQCIAAQTPTVPDLIAADIGPTGAWGYPADESRRGSWRRYHELCWERPGTPDADLYMVDGRFRVACAMQVLLRARVGALLAIHDFASREHYHALRRFAREIAIAEDLSVFLVTEERDLPGIALTLAEHAFDPR